MGGSSGWTVRRHSSTTSGEQWHGRNSNNGRHSDSGVGTMIATRECRELAKSLVIGLGDDVHLEMIKGPLVFIRIMPALLDSIGEDPGLLEHAEGEPDNVGIRDGFIPSRREALRFLHLGPEILNWLIWIPIGGLGGPIGL